MNFKEIKLIGGGGNRRVTSHINSFGAVLMRCLDAKMRRGKVCYDKISSLLWRESGCLNEVNYNHERGLSHELNNRLDCHAIARNDEKNLCHPEFDSGSINVDLSVGKEEPSPEFLSSLQLTKKFNPLTKREGSNFTDTVFSRFTSHFSLGKTAFTLAEVLITLGIIGVVAAMTMPTLIANYQKNMTVNRLKHAYSTLYQAVKLSEAQNGDIGEWQWPSTARNSEKLLSWVERYICPYLKYDNLHNSSSDITSFDLSNGTTVNFWYNGGETVAVTVYWNASKGCILGKNCFPMQIGHTEQKPQNEFSMFHYIQTTPTPDYSKRSTWKDDPSHGCNAAHDKRLCGGLIMFDGWTIAKDYPW